MKLSVHRASFYQLIPEVAKRLGVKPIVVNRWRWSGWLHARQLRGENGRWIGWANGTEGTRSHGLPATRRLTREGLGVAGAVNA